MAVTRAARSRIPVLKQRWKYCWRNMVWHTAVTNMPTAINIPLYDGSGSEVVWLVTHRINRFNSIGWVNCKMSWINLKNYKRLKFRKWLVIYIEGGGHTAAKIKGPAKVLKRTLKREGLHFVNYYSSCIFSSVTLFSAFLFPNFVETFHSRQLIGRMMEGPYKTVHIRWSITIDHLPQIIHC